jgi:hypothetical protein
MQQVTVVNMVNNDQSDETHQDSGPNLTVNLANPIELAGTAFTPDPASGPDAPIYTSADGGNNWSLNPIVPGGNTMMGTYDITLRFASTTSNLYLADIRVKNPIATFDPNYILDILRTPSYLGPAQAVVLEERDNADQPFILAATVPAGPDAGKDRIYVGYTDFSAGPRTASLIVCLDAAAASPVFTTVRLEHRDTSGEIGPQVRPAIHPDGTVYAAYYGWRATTGFFYTNTLVVTDADLVLLRDDNWGQGPDPFTALLDDGVAGQRVVSGLSFPFEMTGNTLGQQRVGGDISIAVDPGNSSTVYLAWADTQPTGYTLHLRRSTDRGVTWSPDLLAIENATNSSLAVTSQGMIGLLYQQLEPGGGRWNTHLLQSPDEVAWHDDLLATTPADIPVSQFDPYLGDYTYLTAVDRTFYGIFCANNTPDPANFPNGVIYHRNHDFTTRTLLGTDGSTPITPSIDPFFFTVVPDPCRALEDQVAALQDEISTLIDALASGEIPPPPKTPASITAVRAEIRELQRELAPLDQRLQQCRAVHPDPP